MRLHCCIEGSKEMCDGYEDTGTMSTILEASAGVIKMIGRLKFNACVGGIVLASNRAKTEYLEH